MKIEKLFGAREALDKIFCYRHWPAAVQFYLCGVVDDVAKYIADYADAYNALLERMGGKSSTGQYEFEGDTALKFQKEYEELNLQEVDFSFDPNRFTIHVDKLDKWEKALPAAERLGLSANDMASLDGIVKITTWKKAA